VKVQDETGNAIEDVFPIGWVDNIVDLEPGEGYKVKVSGDCILSLSKPVSGAKSAPAGRSSKEATHFRVSYPGHGHDHMNIYVMDARVNGMCLEAGDEIGLYDGGQCVGVGVVGQTGSGVIMIAASMDDPTTEGQDGYVEGHAMELRIWSKAHDVEIIPEVIFHSGYQGMFERMGTTVVSVRGVSGEIGAGDGVISQSRLGEPYPNPFHEETIIPYEIAEGSRVELAIYDLTGKRIRTLVSREQSPGSYTVQWDGRDHNENDLPAGVYICRMISGDMVGSVMLEKY
jgi:hypothetical protein